MINSCSEVLPLVWGLVMTIPHQEPRIHLVCKVVRILTSNILFLFQYSLQLAKNHFGYGVNFVQRYLYKDIRKLILQLTCFPAVSISLFC